MTDLMRYFLTVGVFMLIARGLDYLFGNPHQRVNAEEATTTVTWGVVCLVAAGIVIGGMVSKNTRVIVFGCLAAVGVYVTFAGYQVRVVLDPPIDDWRQLSSYLGIAAVWAGLAVSVRLRAEVLADRRARGESEGV